MCRCAIRQAGSHSHFTHDCCFLTTLASAAGVVWAVALTPDGRQALTASEDFTARVWDIMSGTCERVLEGHTGWVVGVAISPDGSHAVTASHDGTAR